MTAANRNPTEAAEEASKARPNASVARRILVWLAMAGITLAGVLVIAVASHPADKDYIAYWSAAKLLLHHADPYSAAAVLHLENAQGALLPKPLIMRNPPWSLVLAMPLGFGSPLPGMILWLLACIGCLYLSSRLLDVPSKDRLLVFLFAPALACLTTGQSSPFLLLGFTLFLRFHQERPFVAGASLLLMAIKPHLFLIFWLLLLVDSIFRRRFMILAGLALALAASTAAAMFFDPRVLPQYFAMAHTAGLDQEFVPTISTLARALTDTGADWIQFLPSCLAIAWGCWYYAQHRSAWNWRTHGMPVILAGILASPYSWFFDEVVLLPCLLFALNLPGRRKHSARVLVAINLLLVLMLLVFQVQLTSGAYLWTPAAWLAWYLYATYHTRQPDPASRPETLQQPAGA